MTRNTSLWLTAVVTLILLTAGTLFFVIPGIWAARLPDIINKQFSQYISVETATFGHFPPTLTLSNVHIVNPTQIGTGDAVTIARVDVVLADYSRDPLHIKTISIDNVHGRYLANDKGDNLTILSSALALRGQEAPTGDMARRVTLGRINIAHVNIQNADASMVQILPNGRMDFTAKPAISLQDALATVADAVVRHQQSGVPALKVENFTEQAGEKLQEVGKTLKSLGGAVMDYLNAPGPPPILKPF